MKDIVVIGAGYGGLVASALLAKEGHNVTAVSYTHLTLPTSDLV